MIFQHLSLSGNTITSLNEESFVNYKTLTYFLDVTERSRYNCYFASIYISTAGKFDNAQYVAFSVNVRPKLFLASKFEDFEFPNDDSLTKYTNLIGLEIRRTLVLGTLTYKWLLHLTKLEDLDISQLDLMGGSVVLQWPLNIKRLNVSGAHLYDLSVASLTKLEVLDASGNFLKQYPHCNLLSPLHTVNVSHNPLNELKVEFLAPYCNLKHLSMKINPNSLIL